jgi:hypothetical protein|tara:strand:- start:6108 stop:6533 length:426 start_codon:yes stop_codon:yes gene_type:complete
MTKLCARGKAAAKRKFKVYPSAYANAYASKICAGKAKDPSGLKRKDWGPKKASEGAEIKIEKLKVEAQKIIDNFPKEKKYKYKKPKKKPYNLTEPTGLGRAMTLDTTTNIKGAAVPLQKMCGGEVRGTGAAIKGKSFKGVF